MTDDFLKNFPVSLRPDEDTTQIFISRFIESNPQNFFLLQQLLKEKKDLAEVMCAFFSFLDQSGVDQKYSQTHFFHSLCEKAKSASEPSL